MVFCLLIMLFLGNVTKEAAVIIIVEQKLQGSGFHLEFFEAMEIEAVSLEVMQMQSGMDSAFLDPIGWKIP